MNKKERITLAHTSLKGVSIGDAFGDSFFGETDQVLACIQNRKIPETSWEFTDDTVMALAVFEQLEQNGEINQDDLALQFSVNHIKDPNRGYGATARRILRKIEKGEYWKETAQNVFDGMGSMGNGASMRVSPIGAYYYDELEKVKEQATYSAVITHANQEGIAGAMAVAIGAALATQSKVEGRIMSPNEFISNVVNELPDTDTRAKIQKSLTISKDYHISTIETILGNGINVIAQDTIPFSIWCAAHHLYNYEEALWKAVSILGDRDTICAIVGGITILSSLEEKIPLTWLRSVEDFDKSIFRNKKTAFPK
ncbi:ADP-ribosylglycohydrolase family protein [Rapidithrix thailandica]|uniref:ADP-ribosylglycohydrolase family protein n=1 Tax=Rapidithrix thailandica TaxID=413964 RepID=A0AAW9SH06_9BACT